jgi:sugar/nucleoside kinase (ribokinase family)
MSDEEATGLTAERYDEPALINQLMSLMVRSLVITRGSRGATLIQQINKKLERHDISGVALGPTVDPTGCGDVFGAAFLYYSLKTENALHAANLANRVAAFKATVRGAEALDPLKQFTEAEFPA